MILALDVYYFNSKAKAICLAFTNWEDIIPYHIYITELDQIEAYIPGEFYKRELPCLLKVLELVALNDIEAIIVDGYVILDDNRKLGLGGHLYEKLGKIIPIIGVAKRSFHNNANHSVEIRRGVSKNPLFITSLGMDRNVAASKIESMSGGYRIPDLLKILDQKTREI